LRIIGDISDLSAFTTRFGRKRADNRITITGIFAIKLGSYYSGTPVQQK
jgi:hypothetical protein